MTCNQLHELLLLKDEAWDLLFDLDDSRDMKMLHEYIIKVSQTLSNLCTNYRCNDE